MQEIHHGMHEARKRGVEDALAPVADAVIRDLRLLAFDEMQITDITDAMIVGRLFEKLFAAGVVIVTTSNRPPRRSVQGRAEPGDLPALHRPAARTGCRWWNWKARPTTASTAWQGAQVYFHPARTATAARSPRSGPT